jgi:hypothetical protein
VAKVASKSLLELTAAGTAPEFSLWKHRIPFLFCEAPASQKPNTIANVRLYFKIGKIGAPFFVTGY